jgi:hypothetical protein
MSLPERVHALSQSILAISPVSFHSTEFRTLRALLSESLGSWDSRRLHHFNLDTSATESAQTPALQDIAKEGEVPARTLPDHFNDTVARILRATGVQQDCFLAHFEQLARAWFDFPEAVRFAILNWNHIPEDTRRALEASVNQALGKREN